MKARGFVLPERADAPGRFVVCWDGLVYPALTVGDPADLDRDIKDLAASMRRRGSAGKSNRFPGSFPGASPAEGRTTTASRASTTTRRSSSACCSDSAAPTWPRPSSPPGRPGRPEPRARDLTDYGISYLTLAVDWAGSAFGRLIGAHMRGDDVIALDAARRLARFRDLASARADAMGFPQGSAEPGGAGPAPRFYFLTQLDELLRDQERRAKMPPRGPIPRKGGDPSARIAALIRDLDQIDEQQMCRPARPIPAARRW